MEDASSLLNNINHMKNLNYFYSQARITKDFNKKLKYNFHSLTIIEKIIYFLFIRWFTDKEKRFFYEGSLRVPGQMYIGDRKALYDIIKKNKPRHCFEIGTYTGGGSTYFLANAFYKIGSGKVITLENNKELYDRAVSFYTKHLTHLLPHVEFVYGDNLESFKPFLDKYKTVDCLFLDGAEDGDETRKQYISFEKYFTKDSIIMAHDWNTEKTANLKPIINNDRTWNKILELNKPESVGFAAFKKTI